MVCSAGFPSPHWTQKQGAAYAKDADYLLENPQTQRAFFPSDLDCGVPRGATLANSLNDIHFQVARVGLNYRFGGP
jgi:hypothetical protein